MRLRTSLQDSRRPGRPDKLIPMQYWQKRQPNATETSVPNQNATRSKRLSNKLFFLFFVLLCRFKSRSREDYSNVLLATSRISTKCCSNTRSLRDITLSRPITIQRIFLRLVLSYSNLSDD